MRSVLLFLILAFAEQAPETSTASLRDRASARNLRIGTAIQARRWTEADYVETAVREFNIVTPENEMKFGPIHPGEAMYNFANADAIVDFATSHAMAGNATCLPTPAVFRLKPLWRGGRIQNTVLGMKVPADAYSSAMAAADGKCILIADFISGPKTRFVEASSRKLLRRYLRFINEGNSMHLFRSFIFSVFVILSLAALVLVPAAGAQTASQTPSQNPSGDGWHVGISPYLWFAGIHGTVGALGKEASVHASFGDIFSQLNIGLMTAVETRHNRIVMPVDFIWMDLSDEKSVSAGPVTSVKADMTQVVLTPKVGYRFFDNGKVKVDALVGFRYWHMGTTITSQPALIIPSASGNWVDALAGGRMQAKVTPKLSLTVLGDIGGGGADSDYQAAGLLGYELNKKWSLSAGYRYMAVNYRPNTAASFVDDTTTSGIIAGVTWNIK